MPEERISSPIMVFMIVMALIFDLADLAVDIFIPLLGFLISSCISVVAWLTLYLWFKIKGVDFTRSNNLLGMFGGALVEMIPLVNVLPGWTMSTIFLCINTRREDRLKIVEHQKNQSEEARKEQAADDADNEDAYYYYNPLQAPEPEPQEGLDAEAGGKDGQNRTEKTPLRNISSEFIKNAANDSQFNQKQRA